MAKEEFAAWFREQARQSGLSQSECATRLNVNRATVLKWGHARSVPMPEMCARIATLFKVPEGDVLALAGWGEELPRR